MNNSKNDIKNILDSDIRYRDKLFCRGYLITDDETISEQEYPFYSLWKKTKLMNCSIYIHPDQHFFYVQQDESIIFLIGNCINPFEIEVDETKILSNVRDITNLNYINQLTGSFILGQIKDGVLQFMTDPTGMLFCCYGKVNQHFYISSHAQLIDDIIGLHKTEYILQFEKYKFFNKYGLSFPGDKTQFKEINRAVPNIIYSYKGDFVFNRIYPLHPLEMCKSGDAYRLTVKTVADILKNTMICALKKWNNPAISLTGGIDSRTTLAAANGFYDHFFIYSYETIEEEKYDCKAASVITNYINQKHVIYKIPNNNDCFEDFNIQKRIIEHNLGDYVCLDNDIRKRIYVNQLADFDIEIKSWVSEIGRANYYKKFGLKKMPEKLSARQMSSIYKIFLWNRTLLKKTDAIFNEYINKYDFNRIPSGYDSSDLFLWEYRFAAWGGLVLTSEQSYSNEMFIPFNNRILLNLMLSIPLDKRINDQFHKDLICENDSIVYHSYDIISNWNETKLRMYVEKLYFIINSKLPF